jgi:CheY-like chemotaxis protein
MAYTGYENLRILVVDDFDNFRMTMAKILMEHGVQLVDTAVSGNEAMKYCREKPYDLILCDYNLGRGKNGQQILEELRHEGLLRAHSIFILVSAESSKSIVMAAYDSEPDAYLTKPITAKSLLQRVDRLLLQRDAMLDVKQAMENGSLAEAIDLCQEKIASASRYTAQCQKLLGQLYLESEQYSLAERVYTDALEVRPLDWAKVGLAKVKRLQGDLVTSNQWLKDVTAENPLCMQAYDELVETCQAQGNSEEVQAVLEQAVAISPMALLRQQSLAQVADQNNDYEMSAKAWRRTVRLGENSVYDRLDNHMNFIRASADLFKENDSLAKDISRDTVKVLEGLSQRFDLKPEEKLQCKLLESRVQFGLGNKNRAQELVDQAEASIKEGEVAVTVTTELEQVQAKTAAGDIAQANVMLAELGEKYSDDEDALQCIDRLLEEPVSATNRARVAQINKEGIGLYNANEFKRSIACFEQAKRLFPNHVGVHLNLVQALVAEMKEFGVQDVQMGLAYAVIKKIEKQINAQHKQFQRYRQLNEMVRNLG